MPATKTTTATAQSIEPTQAPDNVQASGSVRTTGSATIALTTIASLALAACGDDGAINRNSPAPGPSPTGTPTPTPTPVPVKPTTQQAARFLGQASMGATDELIDQVKSMGYETWLDSQLDLGPEQSRWDWMMDRGYFDLTKRSGLSGADQSIWFKAINSPDTVRQRITFALSEIFVVSQMGIVGAGGWRGFACAQYMDLLERHAFGSFRQLLEDVTLSLQMGCYLTMRGSKKANAAGRAPDENYAREVLQLFSLGLYELNRDGTLKLDRGVPIETYGQDDIIGLARVFTGWNTNNYTRDDPGYWRRPMKFTSSLHEPGEKRFLGTTITAGTNGEAAMQTALDRIASHSNVGPFIAKQLIQRLVTSNPSHFYIDRVSRVFDDDGNGVRGNLKAVIKAILLDSEARDDRMVTRDYFGKVREPMLRFVQWARTFGATDVTDEWNIRDLSNAGTRLGQSPLRSPSVFNFYRPGYVPPNTNLGDLQMAAPELQITNETTIVGYSNFMQGVIKGGYAKVKSNYSQELLLVDDAHALVLRIDTLMTANQLSQSTFDTIVSAVESMRNATQSHKLHRVYAAILLVMIAPDYLVQK